MMMGIESKQGETPFLVYLNESATVSTACRLGNLLNNRTSVMKIRVCMVQCPWVGVGLKLAVKMGVRMLAHHRTVPGYESLPWLLSPASCSCRHLQAAVTDHITGGGVAQEVLQSTSKLSLDACIVFQSTGLRSGHPASDPATC